MYRKNPTDPLRPWKIDIKIDGKRIEPSTHVKYVGVLLDSHLEWNYHVDDLSAKLSRAVGMLAKIRHYVSTNTLNMIYHGIFSSLLMYGSQIWGQSNSSISKMEKLQNRALRIINFEGYRSSTDELYKKSEILKFADSKIEISNFIWDSYFQEVDNNNPYALTLFEKKIKSLCNDVKDKTLAKYFLDNFTRRINELTPNINFRKNNFSKFKKMLNPLQKTKDVYKQRNKFKEEELKEFSILFLIINNLDIFRKKIELIPEITFSNNIMNEFKKRLIVSLNFMSKSSKFNFFLSKNFSDNK